MSDPLPFPPRKRPRRPTCPLDDDDCKDTNPLPSFGVSRPDRSLFTFSDDAVQAEIQRGSVDQRLRARITAVVTFLDDLSEEFYGRRKNAFLRKYGTPTAWPHAALDDLEAHLLVVNKEYSYIANERAERYPVSLDYEIALLRKQADSDIPMTERPKNADGRPVRKTTPQYAEAVEERKKRLQAKIDDLEKDNEMIVAERTKTSDADFVHLLLYAEQHLRPIITFACQV